MVFLSQPVRDASVGRKALMCAPTYFDIKYAINPQMKAALARGEKVNKPRAFSQWMRLASLLLMSGVENRYIFSRRDTPDMVFTANAGFVNNGRVAISRFAHDERRKEEKRFARFFKKELGIVPQKWQSLSSRPGFFEGGGDVLRHGDAIFCGYGKRSTRSGIGNALTALGYAGKIVYLELVNDDFYHLDTCFCSLGKHILWYPPAFSHEAQKELPQFLPAGGFTIAVSKEDAEGLACNGIFLENGGQKILITSPLSPRLRGTLEDLGITVYENDISEFLKSGGGNQCLVLFLN